LLLCHDYIIYSLIILFLLLLIQRPPTSTLFPYTTLFPISSSEQLAVLWRFIFAVGKEVRKRTRIGLEGFFPQTEELIPGGGSPRDRKSTRLNSSHLGISYAVFCLKKKRKVSSYKDWVTPTQ